jgi:hypothetical protein
VFDPQKRHSLLRPSILFLPSSQVCRPVCALFSFALVWTACVRMGRDSKLRSQSINQTHQLEPVECELLCRRLEHFTCSRTVRAFLITICPLTLGWICTSWKGAGNMKAGNVHHTILSYHTIDVCSQHRTCLRSHHANHKISPS